MRDHGAFGDPAAPQNALLVECGQHWEAASADVAVAKAGYGTVCEAIVAGTPLVYPPRSGFAEHRALDRALRAWGGGLPVPSRDFTGLRLERWLDRGDGWFVATAVPARA